MPATTKVEGEVTDLATHARYTYTDEDGEPLFQVRRRPRGDGKTSLSSDGRMMVGSQDWAKSSRSSIACTR